MTQNIIEETIQAGLAVKALNVAIQSLQEKNVSTQEARTPSRDLRVLDTVA